MDMSTPAQVQAAQDAAVKALASKDRTRSELVEFLSTRRHSPVAIDAAISNLEEVGVVDDRRVAEVIIRTRLAEGHFARALVEASLLERGVEPGLVKAVLGELVSDRDEGGEALEIARLRVRTSRAKLTPETIKRRVFAFLARRGFDEETARQAVETAADEYLGRP